jgi:hypothetical protein
MPAGRLELARTVVRIFDLVIVLLVALTIILVALAVWLARDHRRMLIYVGIGTIIAFLVGRLAIRSVEGVIVGGIADGDVAGAARAMLDATLEDLRGLTLIILIGTVIVVIAAYLWGRPAWAVTTTSSVANAAGRAGSAASAGVAGTPGRVPDRDTLEATVRTNHVAVERIGLGVIVFIIAWLAVGFEIALLGAALVVGFEVVLRALSSPTEPDADDAPVEGQREDNA